ncbi:hypothetical protein C0991_005143, partial [Blastosporella zonata]
VNLGGLFVLEPFISPALFQKYPGAVDEWTLSTLMAADTANGGLNQLEDHYNTFITEEDIAEIAGAGLNWVRVPVPFWAIEVWPGEPFLAQTSWKYIERLLGWCRKYGIRVSLDFHTMPGSQNGYNHSGKLGQVNFLNGVMGIANAQRALEYIRVFTEFISQPQYKNVVPMFGIVNEAHLETIGVPQLTNPGYLRTFSPSYLEAHTMIRSITGYGEGNGPYISIHDGFAGLAAWGGFLKGSDRINLDVHPYLAFDGSSATSPIDTGTGDWFFWTWKVGNTTAGKVESPLWSYQLGLHNGWMPKDPRTALGTCESLGVSGPNFDGVFEPWQTGGVGAGTIAASSTASYPWPPATIFNAGVHGSALPVYTPTGTVATLAPPTLTASATASVNAGNGWFNAQDNGGAPTPIAGCKYPDAWDAIGVPVPPHCN